MKTWLLVAALLAVGAGFAGAGAAAPPVSPHSVAEGFSPLSACRSVSHAGNGVNASATALRPASGRTETELRSLPGVSDPCASGAKRDAVSQAENGRIPSERRSATRLEMRGTPSVRIVVTGNPDVRAVAFTFDAGADRGYAARILSTLERARVRASFGMTGRWARQNPDLVRRIARDGDALINHTYDHRSFTGYSSGTGALSLATRTWEINTADAIIRKLSGHTSKPYFRPPYGDYDKATLALLSRLGYRYMIMWTVDSLGWNHLPAPAILTRCLAGLAPGAIYLMHVGIQSQDALALPQLIARIKSRGYRFLTIPEIVG